VTKRRSVKALRQNARPRDRREVSLEITEGDTQVWLAIKTFGGETSAVSGNYTMTREDWDRLRGIPASTGDLALDL
jgi:hypothetical protein